MSDPKLQIPKIEDPRFPEQWNLKLMNVQPNLAWKYSMGDGVVIGLMDSGVDFTHQDLGSKKYVDITAMDGEGAREAKYEDILVDIRAGRHEKILPGWNFLEDESNDDVYDEYRHGTSVAGIMCADADNIGIVGVAPKAKIRPYVVADTRGWVDQAVLAQAIRRATQDGCDVINISLAWSSDHNEGVTEAIKEAMAKNIIVVAATGNNDYSYIYYPACIEGVIAVGGCNAVGERWVHSKNRGSNYGPGMTCLAPADAQLTTRQMRSRYEMIDGTSLACANASGVMALIKSVNKVVHNDDILRYLMVTKKWTHDKGYGVLDAYELVQYFYKDTSSNEKLCDQLEDQLMNALELVKQLRAL